MSFVLGGAKPVPRNLIALVVLIIARISGGVRQLEQSLLDQEARARYIVSMLFDGPVQFIVVATKNKGALLFRPELEVIEKHLRGRKIDLFLLEDLGRLVHGEEAVRLLGIGKDHGVRSIAPNDNVDTDDPSWHPNALAACRDHVAHSEHTSKRIKTRNMHRFEDFGGCPGRPPATYTIPDGAKTYKQWVRMEHWTPIINQAADMLIKDADCVAVAEFFELHGVPVGPYCRRKNWYSKMVYRFFCNPLLKGMAQRGVKSTVKHNESGRRIPRKNPNGPSYYPVPHLAHLSAEKFDAVGRRLKEAHAGCGRKKQDGQDPLAGVSRKSSRFPGKKACCWYCGRTMVWGANGVKTRLMCPGSREYWCWNSIGFNGEALTNAILKAIGDKLRTLDSFETQFKAIVEEVRGKTPATLARQSEELSHKQAELDGQKANLLKALGKVGDSPVLLEGLKSLQDALAALAIERLKINEQMEAKNPLPPTLIDVRTKWDEAVQVLGTDSLVFGNMLRNLVKELHIYLVSLGDDGRPLSRARVVLDLLADYPAAADIPELAAISRQTLTIDLFETPIIEKIRMEAGRLHASGMTYAQIVQNLPIATSERQVGQALRLQQKMNVNGLTDPYVFLAEPPETNKKFRRHRRKSYIFQPLEGYKAPPLT